jgi:hypothetical protein
MICCKRMFIACLAAFGAGGVLAVAQQPAGDDSKQSLTAMVLEVVGDVKKAAVGLDATKADGWEPVKVNDQLSSGTQIKTGFRSSLVMKFGDDTVVQLRKTALASIDQYYRDATTKTVRLGLGYGKIRGGSVEGELRSEFTVDTTVATLAKRGTEGFEMEFEPSSGRFNISLSRSGLLEALSKASGKTKAVRPGEYANQDNLLTMWINTQVFDRAFKFYSSESQTGIEEFFASENNSGVGVLAPGSGSDVVGFSQRDVMMRDGGMTVVDGGQAPPFVIRPEGDFGVRDTFSGLLGQFLNFKRAPAERHAIRRTTLNGARKARVRVGR